MFERFSEPSRRALFFASCLAARAGRDAIEIVDVVAGALWADSTVVEQFGVSPAKILVALGIEGSAPELASAIRQNRLSHSVQGLLKVAEGEADYRDQKVIRSEHLLLAVFLLPPSAVSQVLEAAGVDCEQLRRSAAAAAVRDDTVPPFRSRLTSTEE